MGTERRILRIDMTDPAEPRILGYEARAAEPPRRQHPRPGERWFRPVTNTVYTVADLLDETDNHGPLVLLAPLVGGYVVTVRLEHFLDHYVLSGGAI